MIPLTRLNGEEIFINADLIERIEATPDTVLSLVDGKKYVARENPRELIDRIVEFRARILVEAERMQDDSHLPAGPRVGHVAPRPLRLIEDHPTD